MSCCVEHEVGGVAMPLPSQIVVEDYIERKIRTKFSNFSRATSLVAQMDSSSTTQVIALSSGSKARSDLSISLWNLACEYERRYKSNYPDLFHEMKNTPVSPDKIENTLRRLSQMLFQLPLKPLITSNSSSSEGVITEEVNYNTYRNYSYDDSHISWGHIIALLVFAGALATHAVELDCYDQVEMIIAWVSNFYDTQLSTWFSKNGGWSTLIKWSRAANGNMNAYDDYDAHVSVRSVMSVGVLAACVGFGALIMARK